MVGFEYVGYETTAGSRVSEAETSDVEGKCATMYLRLHGDKLIDSGDLLS